MKRSIAGLWISLDSFYSCVVKSSTGSVAGKELYDGLKGSLKIVAAIDAVGGKKYLSSVVK